METRIVNHGFPESNPKDGVMQVGVVEQSIKYIQHSDTCDTDRYQQMSFQTVGVDFDEVDNTDSFVRVSIGPGDPDEADIAPFWSCNGPEEFVKLFNDFAQRAGWSCRWKIEKYHVA